MILPEGSSFWSFWNLRIASFESASHVPVGSFFRYPRSARAFWISLYRSDVGDNCLTRLACVRDRLFRWDEADRDGFVLPDFGE